MQCAKCHKDFKEDEKHKGFFTQQNDHFMRPYRTFGISCPFCGFHNMIFQIPIQFPFIRTARTYESLDKLVADIKTMLEEFLKSKNKQLKNPDLFGHEPED